MPIDFFSAACTNSSTANKFGLCDDPPPSTDPAYIDEINPPIWIGVVINPTQKKVDFYAVDHCIILLRADGTHDNHCEGILKYDNELMIVELKDRGSKGWLKTACDQIIAGYTHFMIHHGTDGFDLHEAYACNKQRPYINQGIATHLQRIKTEIGLDLKVQATINIP